MLPLPSLCGCCCGQNCCATESSLGTNRHSTAGPIVIQTQPRPVASSEILPLHQIHHCPQPRHHFSTPYPCDQPSIMDGGIFNETIVAKSENLVTSPVFWVPSPMFFQPTLADNFQLTQGDATLPSLLFDGESGSTAYQRIGSLKHLKICDVCGDNARSKHYGGVSCECCRAFFRRAVTTKTYTKFSCTFYSRCEINLKTRKNCQFCRFQKCVAIGMDKGLVMGEEEKYQLNQMRLSRMQARLAKLPLPKSFNFSTAVKILATASHGRLAGPTQSSLEPKLTFQDSTLKSDKSSYEFAGVLTPQDVALVGQMWNLMTHDEIKSINSLLETYYRAYEDVPYQLSYEQNQTVNMIEMFNTLLRRFGYFATLIPEFAAINKRDQNNLLRTGVLGMIFCRSAVCFDTTEQRWPSSRMKLLNDCPLVWLEDMKRVVSVELAEMHTAFIHRMKYLGIDEPMAMLLIMINLFSSDCTPVEDKVKVKQVQRQYQILLQKYCLCKFGEAVGTFAYLQLLAKLADLREISKIHAFYHLNVGSKDVDTIKTSVAELTLNSYPNREILLSSSRSPGVATPKLPALLPSVGEGSESELTGASARMLGLVDRGFPALPDDPHTICDTDLRMSSGVQQILVPPLPAVGVSQGQLSVSNLSLPPPK